MVWRIAGAVTLSEIWMFHISLSPCAAKSDSFGITDTSRISWPRRLGHPTVSSALRSNGAAFICPLCYKAAAPSLWRSDVASERRFSLVLLTCGASSNSLPLVDHVPRDGGLRRFRPTPRCGLGDGAAADLPASEAGRLAVLRWVCRNVAGAVALLKSIS